MRQHRLIRSQKPCWKGSKNGRQNIYADGRIKGQDVHEHPNIPSKLLFQLIERRELNDTAGAGRKILKAPQDDSDTLTRRLQLKSIGDLTNGRGPIRAAECVTLHRLRKYRSNLTSTVSKSIAKIRVKE